MFEAGEDDLLFPTEQGCEPVKEPVKKRGFDPSQPLWGIDYLLRNEGNDEVVTANRK